MGGDGQPAEVSSGSGGGFAQTSVGKYGSPGSGPSSGSGDSYGGKVTAASGGGEPETSAGVCDSGRACGVGETAPIVPLGAADFGTTVSAETHQAGLE